MSMELLPFLVKYKHKNGTEREGVVFAYDEKTARSRACHDAMVDKREDNISVKAVSPADIEYMASGRPKLKK